MNHMHVYTHMNAITLAGLSKSAVDRRFLVSPATKKKKIGKRWCCYNLVAVYFPRFSYLATLNLQLKQLA